jgi:hypothetical protein
MASGCNTGNGYYEALTSSDNSGLIDIESTTWVGSNGGGLFCGKCINGSSTKTSSCSGGILASWSESAALKTKKCYKCHKPTLDSYTKVEYIDNNSTNKSWHESSDNFLMSSESGSTDTYTGSLSLDKMGTGTCSNGGSCNVKLKITAYIYDLTETRCKSLSVNGGKSTSTSFNDAGSCEITTTTADVTGSVQNANNAEYTYQYITVSVAEGSNKFSLKYTVVIPVASW